MVRFLPKLGKHNVRLLWGAEAPRNVEACMRRFVERGWLVGMVARPGRFLVRVELRLSVATALLLCAWLKCTTEKRSRYTSDVYEAHTLW